MSACNDCWDEAFRRSQIGGGHQSEHYEAILLMPPHERPWCRFALGLDGGEGRGGLPFTPPENEEPTCPTCGQALFTHGIVGRCVPSDDGGEDRG